MVEVFKTNITKYKSAKDVRQELLRLYPNSIIDFDLDDCDKILRVENCLVKPKFVVQILINKGFECDLLE